MTRDQITLVQESFRALLPFKIKAAEMFYDRLFTLDPSLKPMFANTNLQAQGAKLMAALGFVVGALRTPAALEAPVRELAIRHKGYGVRDSHYATVGRALVDTLQDALADRWTPQLWAAWAEAYGIVSAMMIAAARDHTATLNSAA